jgi:hypothetical protein
MLIITPRLLDHSSPLLHSLPSPKIFRKALRRLPPSQSSGIGLVCRYAPAGHLISNDSCLPSRRAVVVAAAAGCHRSNRCR